MVTKSVDPRKRDSIEHAAAQLFFTAGYEATSMDKIASNARVSKATLYSYYSDKRTLFEATVRSVFEDSCDKYFQETIAGDWTRTLVRVAIDVLGDLTSPRSVGVFRAVAGCSDRCPEISGIFYETLIRANHRAIHAFLSRLADGGAIEIIDPEQAADILLDLLIGRFFIRRSLGIADDADLAQVAERAVSTFLRAYALQDMASCPT